MASTITCPPPPGFKPAGEVTVAKLASGQPPFIRKKKYTGRRAEGIRYEKKVQEFLLSCFPDTYLPSPWLHFLSGERWRWCQPDGLIFDFERGVITVVEVKYSHTSDAWWQVRELYMPVLAKIFPERLWKLQACEVVKWYDGTIPFPESVEMASEPDRPSKKFKVHIWRP